ncbi:MAG: DUF3857 domain-containing protein [Thermoanaerobaculales bacterium]
MMRRVVSLFLTVVLVGLTANLSAGEIEDRVHRHLEAAADGGLQPADFHHLFMAFSWRQTFSDWRIAVRGLDRLTGVRRQNPLMTDELRLIRSKLELEQGRAAVARELFRSMGGLSAWWFLGPEPLEELEDFSNLAQAPSADLPWRSVPGVDPLGWLRISGLAWPAQRQMAYLATTVMSDREQPLAVRVGAAQAARVWVNGIEVLTTPQPLERAEDQVAAGSWLRAGQNLLVVAVASENDQWWLRVRLTRPNGEPLAGVREVNEAPTLQPGVDRKAPEVRELGREIRRAVDAGTPGARMALAAYLVARRPEAIGGGGARAACRDARAEAPGEARLLEWILTSEPRVAHELLAEAVKVEPDLVWARLELAGWYGERSLFEEGQMVLGGSGSGDAAVQGAALDLDSALWGQLMLPALADLAQRYPYCVRVNATLATLAAEARRWDHATAATARLVEFNPGSRAVLELRQRLAESCGDGEALRELYSLLLARDPNRPEVRVRLARLQGGDGDASSARSVLDEGLRRSPTNVDLMMELARIEHSDGNDERAISIAQKVLEVRPQDLRAQRLLELLGELSEDLAWLRTPEQLWGMADEAPEANPAIVLLDHREIRFFASNLTEERVQRAFLITSADRADDFLTQTLPFVAESERLRVLRARILRRDGTELSARQGDTPRLSEPEFNLYYDTRLRVLRFPEFADGDLVEIAYILTETAEANETGPYNGGLIRLGQRVPMALVEVELSGPEDLLPAWELAHLEGEPQREKGRDGVVHLRWQWKDLAAVPPDVPSAPDLLVTPHLVYSNHPDWGGLADWYRRHVAPRIRASEQVKATAQRLVDGHTDRRDRIDRIYRFVTNDIRYVGLEFGEHRFRPFSADWVLHHRIGDCKDKAALLVALFDAIGIPARMVMLRTADQGPIATEIALMEIFNHAIAYLPEDDLWLDGTAAGHASFPPPGPDQGAVVLVVEDRLSRLQTSPVEGGGLARSRYVLRIGAGDQVELAVHAEDTGEAADIRRARFAGSQEPVRLARWLQVQFPGAELTGEPKLQLVPGQDPTIVEIEGTIPRSALASGGGVRTFPGVLEWSASGVPGGRRHGPLTLAVRPDLEWTLEVELGRVPNSLPSPVDLQTRFGSLRLDARVVDLGYRMDGYLRFEPGLVPAEDVAELREFLIAVERHLGRRLESP